MHMLDISITAGESKDTGSPTSTRINLAPTIENLEDAIGLEVSFAE